MERGTCGCCHFSSMHLRSVSESVCYCCITWKLFRTEIDDIGGGEWRATTCGLALPLFCPTHEQIIFYFIFILMN